VLRVGVVVSLMVLVAAGDGAAQQSDSARAGVRATAGDTTGRAVRRERAPRAPQVRDSLSPPVSPGRAFLLSLALPGLAQSRLNRPTAGAVYFTAEAIYLAMLGKAANDLRIAKAHAGDVIVNSYAVDGNTGAPIIIDSVYSVKDTLRSKYADPIATGSAGTSQDQRSRVKARRLHFEDWIAMLAFNHLFSAADAFVSSQLWDLPVQVEMRTLRRGSGIGITIPFR
jgi:hypothetical protein